MREIKFRFWGPFGEWIEPDEMEQKKIMLYGDEFAWEEYEPINDLFAGLDETIAMQYTGLKDRNGREIYEGDIIRFNQHEEGYSEYGEPRQTAVVRWSSLAVGFAPMAEGPCEFDSIMVIGNIYENPELLEHRHD